MQPRPATLAAPTSAAPAGAQIVSGQVVVPQPPAADPAAPAEASAPPLRFDAKRQAVDVALFLDAVPPSSRPARDSQSDPYAHLDLEPDFAWRPADGSQPWVDRDGFVARPPEWVRRSGRQRRRGRLIAAASWLVTAMVFLGVSAGALTMLLGTEHSRELLARLATRVGLETPR